MSVEVFSTIMKQLQDIQYQGKINYHFYNEPMLHPELPRLVAESKKWLPESKSEIYTNGMFLNRERFDELTAAGVDKFSVTKHSGIKKIPFEDVWATLSDEEKRKHRFIDHNELLYTNRGGLVKYGKELSEEILSRPCYIPCASIVITIEGNVLACYEDYHQKNIMGNIHEQSLAEIWNSEKYISFREDLKKGHRRNHEVCSTCNNRLMF